MAKKVSPIIIPAVIDTSGVDKGVSQIQSKLKKVGGSSGVGGYGGAGVSTGAFGGGGAAAAAALSGGAAAAGAALGAAAAGRIGAAAAGRGGFEGLSRGARMFAQNRQLTSQSTRAFQDMIRRGRDYLADPMWENEDAFDRARNRYRSTLENQDRLRSAVGRGMQMRSFRQNLGGIRPLARGIANSGVGGRLLGAGALIAGGNFERFMQGQFTDYNAFQQYGQANYSLVDRYRNADKKTPSTIQAFMLGQHRYGHKGAVSYLGESFSLGTRYLSTAVGSLLSNPLKAIPEILNPTSSLALQSQGINVPAPATAGQAWSDMFGAWWDHFRSENPIAVAQREVQRMNGQIRATKAGNQ